MKQKVIDFFKTEHGIFLVVFTIVIIGASITIFKTVNNIIGANRLELKLAQTEEKLHLLSNQRDSLNAYIVNQESQLLAKDNLIEFFKLKDEGLQYKLEGINKQIKSLNDKYEKASHFTDHYNSDSIVLYFSKYDRHYKTSK